MPAPPEPWPPAAPCCPPASAPSKARSTAATPSLIVGPDGTPLGRGLSAYASTDAERIAGHRSDEIEAILGWRGRDEMVHRDDLVLG